MVRCVLWKSITCIDDTSLEEHFAQLLSNARYVLNLKAQTACITSLPDEAEILERKIALSSCISSGAPINSRYIKVPLPPKIQRQYRDHSDRRYLCDREEKTTVNVRI